MLMTIDLKEKQYNDNTYYEYYIVKLFLRNELTKLIPMPMKLS